MKVVPLAAESLGVRSMATYVEAGPTGILIDPGATLSPSRFNLPPSEEEWEALRRANDRISAYAARAEVVFVSHYHEDHFRSDPASYAGRTVLLKDPRRSTAGLQARRAGELWTALAPVARVQSAVVTAAGYLGLADAPLEGRRGDAWAAARKPPARAGRSRERAMISRAPKRLAKGGTSA